MRPLEGCLVVDFSTLLPGPLATLILAEAGAEVIKIERPGGDEMRAWQPRWGSQSVYFALLNRGKKSVVLDLKNVEHREKLKPLVARADVLVEQFRPGVMARLGLDYASLAAGHPRLVYCSISGFGHTGPRKGEAGYDAVMQAEGGLMSITGAADGPPFRLGVAIADVVSGMFAAQGIAMALLARERTGRGQAVDVAMLDSVAALLVYQASIYFATGSAPSRMGNRHPTIVPYETFAASDGDFVIAVGNDDQWRRFCRVADLEDDERFATNRSRVTQYAVLKPILSDRLRTRTRAQWIEGLTKAGVPCGSVRDLHEVFNDPQIAAREMIALAEHATIGPLRLLGVPIKLSDTPASVRAAPPTLGQHTAAVLQNDLGLSPQEVAALQARGVI